MLLREALALLRSPRYSDTHRLCLVCSFEPLHFKTYLQAFLVERFPEAAPQVTSWGYDQLEAGLQESSRALRVHPALLFLSWGDLHPHLSWRTRGPLAMPPPGEIQERADRLRERLIGWLTARGGADSYVRSEEHTSELQSQSNLVCRLLLEKKKHYMRGRGAPNHII